MTYLGVFYDQGWSWVLEKVLFSFEFLKVTDDWWNVEVTSSQVWKRINKEIQSYGKKREIFPKIVKKSHFSIDILEKPDFFPRQFEYQKDDRNLKFYLLFEN